MNTLIKDSFLNALATAVYIMIVVSIMFNAERFMGQDDNILIPISFLMLFVLSAAIVGGLVVGKPAMMYVNGQRQEAVKLFVYTVGWLALATAIAITISALKII